QENEEDGSEQGMAAQLPPRLPLRQPAGIRERQRRADHEHERRLDQIPKSAPDPRHMAELIAQKLPRGIVREVSPRLRDSRPPRPPAPPPPARDKRRESRAVAAQTAEGRGASTEQISARPSFSPKQKPPHSIRHQQELAKII